MLSIIKGDNCAENDRLHKCIRVRKISWRMSQQNNVKKDLYRMMKYHIYSKEELFS